MKVYSIYPYKVQVTNTQRQNNFKGAGQEIISEGFKECVSDLLPIYKTVRCINKVGKGDSKGAIKQGVGLADNIVCQPAKQALATAAAAKGALIGSAILPGIGTGIGAITGYVGTLLCWGKVRNTVVDALMD